MTAATMAAIGALVLAGCAQSGTPANTDSPAPSGDATAAAGTCGAVPEVGANDPNGLLADMSAEVQAGYNGYPFEIQESAWADFKSEKTEGFTAAIVGTAPAAPFIAAYQNALAESLEKAGVDIVLNVAPNDPSDVPGQLQQFSQALALKPDIIFFNPVAPEPAIDLVNEAHDAGIPVVSLVVPIDSPNAVSVVYNAVLQSMSTASAMFGAMGGSGDVLEVSGVAGIPNQIFWDAGRDHALALCPDINVVGSVQGMFQPPLAQQAVVQYLSTNPAGVDGVIQAGTMGWAIRDAFVQSGHEVPPIQDLGASQGMAAYAAEHPDFIYYGSITPPVAMAQGAAQIGLKILQGAGPKVNQVVWSPHIIDASTVGEFVDPSWSTEDGTDLTSDSVYFTDEQTAEFFKNPELGPQSAE
ncbi:substrate-binding domain-containing protein [Gulosibacter macacae]|uniref:substrate-binding domain-containing protein n=1 Tax=Gulosibacter macacae TaxID=2488791 RepID=UPI00163B38A8|nr:substrate-binding domain-containing protein [Gulosibacter macacae]